MVVRRGTDLLADATSLRCGSQFYASDSESHCIFVML